MTENEMTRCEKCLYGDKCRQCKKGTEVHNECISDDYSWFESKYIFDEDTGEIIYSEEFEEDEEDIDNDYWHEMCLSNPNLSEQ